ncbi:MAG: hypothetical protein ACREJO_15545 [Phycisphaerales bacterium]
MRTVEEREAWLARHNLQPQTPFADWAGDTAQHKLQMQFEMQTNCPVVPVEIDGRRMLAMLDTGAGLPLMLIRWTGDKPLARWQQTNTVSWNGPRTYARAPEPVALTVGGHTVNVSADYALDPDEFLFLPCDVVIGWPVLAQWSWSIDFEEGVFRFVP